ncbi:hypothetical protein P692DRAFT_201732639 [Suillus brevipes Sb2]|nr:hypothetical protein P692DRAFT_201732639 [Suillus brevipes Sb2]
MITLSSKAKQPLREAWSLERLIHERSILLGLALDNSTFRSYSSHLNSYLAFCNLHQLPIDPTPDTLSYFVTFMSHHIQPRSVDAYLSGIVNQLEPHFPNVRRSRHSMLVKRTLRGALHSLGRPIERKQPLLRDDLLRVYSSLQHPLSHDDLLWVTQLHCGFYGLLRLGELVAPDEAALREFSKFSLRTSVTFRRFFSGSFSGHSMRAGGATSLASAGVSPEQIRAIGRWSTNTWERYVRKNPSLLQAMLFHGRPPHDPPFANAS